MTHAHVKDDELEHLAALKCSMYKLRSLSCKFSQLESVSKLAQFIKKLVGLQTLTIEPNGVIFGSEALEKLFQLDSRSRTPHPARATLRQIALPRSVLSTKAIAALFSAFQCLEDVILDLGTIHTEQNLRLFEMLPRFSASRMFFWACAVGNIPVVEDMLRRRTELELNINGRFYGWTPLLVACAENKAEIAVMLVDSGAQVNVASTCGWRKDREYAGFSPLMLVARSGLAHAAKVLLDAGADPNYMIPPLFPTAGMTPLIEAAWGSHKEVVDLLLTFKASAHSYRLCDIQSDSRYENGVTPLHMTPSAPIAKLLIENVGLNPLAKDCVGWTPISFAAYRGWAPATLSALLDASEDTGVDEFVSDETDYAIDPRTPLVLAIEAGKVDSVETLLERETVQEQLLTPISGILPIEAAALATISENHQVRILSALQNAMLERFGQIEVSMDKNAIMGKVLESFRGAYCSDCDVPRVEGETTFFQPMWKCTVCNGSANSSSGSKGDMICSACATTCHTMCGHNGIGGQLSYHGHDVYKNCACHASSKCLFRHAGLLSGPDQTMMKRPTHAFASTSGEEYPVS